jgi:hypothetical protein
MFAIANYGLVPAVTLGKSVFYGKKQNSFSRVKRVIF